MATGQVKKLYIIQILNILKNYSDIDHPLLQRDIIDYMSKDYNVECERKAVGRNIENLKDLGYEIEYNNGYYLVQREFEESELRFLVDSILASRYIPVNQAKDLIKKLTDQSNIYFKDKVKHISNIANMDHQETNEMFYTIDILSEAIARKKQVKFFYRKYNLEKKLINTSSEKHLVNPYQIILANGKYYLIGNVDKYDNVTHFRVERIWDIEMEGSKRKDPNEVNELKNGLDLPKHMLEHIYMFGGESVPVTLRIDNGVIGDIIDWLGTEIEIVQEEDGLHSQVMFKANQNAMKYWAMQFGEKVVVLKPEALRNQVKDLILNIKKNYFEEE
ncbi:MAG: WYL domain-containing protein [Anaerovoracaceae bacterium]|nr:WYL domain-containing protein [Anaerovoracaceae bacterium]